MPKISFLLHLSGQVQGVGFRPFVWLLATKWGLRGRVSNAADGVHIVFNAGAAEPFLEAVLREAPALARITEARWEQIPYQEFDDFQIVHSDVEAQPNLLLTPDIALCADCRRELHDPANRRFGYALITCTNCGPRYSILDSLPYDRARTRMAPFVQCPACQSEYEQPADRRYYSQTNACADCGPQWSLQDAAGWHFPAPLQTALSWLHAGRILAVKGGGGYLLVCDATQASAIRTLRTRKRRPSKPFALLYPSVAILKHDVELRPEEQAALEGTAAPIVLVACPSTPPSGICLEAIAPGLQQIGVMLPYSPLLELLATGFGKPLIATSGNASGAPIVFCDEVALRELQGIADGFLMHNREIAVPQDDSVLRFSRVHGRQIILRRSRGMALHWGTTAREQPLLALGASMKGAFALQQGRNVFVSQYLGDLEQFDARQQFDYTLRHCLSLFRAQPARILTDLHPDYFTTLLGQALAADWNLPVSAFQHHKAHFAAVLAENDLLEREEAVLGVIWDGTGYGEDGQIWGGEFFRWAGRQMERVGYFSYFDLLVGDNMSREPRLSALSLSHEWAGEILAPKFTPTEWSLYGRMLQKGGSIQCSSAGRVFDAAACLLGLADRSTYEGEAALLLEAAAARYFATNGLRALPLAGELAWSGGSYPVRELIAQTYRVFRTSESVEKAAAYFHLQLVAAIDAACRAWDCKALACSGGVWQNAVLTDLVLEWLAPRYPVYFHKAQSPNDECVALGQWALASVE
ncbi:MAG: carbamoyltransferase HypF [Saprospiraceae bacterium]